jgi:hypothetical protein
VYFGLIDHHGNTFSVRMGRRTGDRASFDPFHKDVVSAIESPHVYVAIPSDRDKPSRVRHPFETAATQGTARTHLFRRGPFIVRSLTVTGAFRALRVDERPNDDPSPL